MSKYQIGVVTFFDANNYGAVLQTYALQEFLKQNNIKSCILNYKWHPDDKVRSLRGFLYYLKYKKYIKKKKYSFSEFLNKCNFSSFYNKENIKEANYECERFVVGSDQVWNSKWNFNSDVFYLTFTDQKFSYAASFGSVSSISSYRHILIRDDLSKFKSLSVRENSAVEYLENLGLKASSNIDPVFLLDKPTWEKISIVPKFDKYLLIYSLENNEEMISFAKVYAKKNNLTPVIIVDTKKKSLYGCKVVSFCSPDEFLGLFNKASAIVTNSFHGTAFSILFQKSKFFVFLQKNKNAPNDRMIDLLKACNLSNRIVDENFAYSKVDYFDAINYIKREKENAKNYFLKIVNGDLDSNKVFRDAFFRKQYFYAKSKDIQDIAGSRSGGIAYLLGKKYLSNNGVVYGACLNDDNSVSICRAITLSELNKTRNSKYVSSDISNSLELCAKDLSEGKSVLFSALPCQVNSLLNYLNVKKIDTTNLLTVDIVCHGTVEQKYFLRYINFLEKKHNSKIINFNFRDKKYGWDTHFESYMANNKKYFSKMYTRFFYSNYGLKEGCYKCPFSNFERKSDITLMDAWGYIKPKDVKTGASILMINTEEGLRIFQKICLDVDFEEIERLETIQPNLMSTSKKPNLYDLFKTDYVDKDFKVIYKFCAKSVIKDEKTNRRKARLLSLLKILKLTK